MDKEDIKSFELKSENQIPKKLTFYGKGSSYFGLWVVNIILTILTLGLYYPWLKASVRKYTWGETELEGNRFVFNGTGKEIFKGFIKVYLVVLIIIGFQLYGNLSQSGSIKFIAYILTSFAVFIFVPLSIFGAVKYRLSRTSWRGIFFSFKGNLNQFFSLYLKNIFLSIVTFGFYGPWMQNNIRKYIISNSKFGNLRFGYDGTGLEYFKIMFFGNILVFFTAGIYFPWYIKNLFNFHVNNMYLLDETGGKKYLKSNLTGTICFGTMFSNLLLGVLTLGLGFAWIFIRNMEMYVNSIQMPQDIDFSTVYQEADDYKNATGDDLADVLDIGIDF